MHVFSILLFAVSSNMDNFAVSLSYGVKKIRVSFSSNIIIGLITFLGTLLSMLIGKSLLIVIPVSLANILGGVIITGIGCAYLIKFILGAVKKKASRQTEDETYGRYDKDQSGDIDWREAFALGFALSINNVGLGISASITGLNAYITAACSLLCSLIFIYISNLLGKNCVSKFLGKYTDPVASILIIILGLYEIFA